LNNIPWLHLSWLWLQLIQYLLNPHQEHARKEHVSSHRTPDMFPQLMLWINALITRRTITLGIQHHEMACTSHKNTVKNGASAAAATAELLTTTSK
jgi:predicted glycoside hydrolase/deacetylase ChbG (UPF0249 family)